jgi:rRNA maturation protein Nop10
MNKTKIGLCPYIICDEDKETITGWAEAELEMKPEQFSNKDHYNDYMRRVKRIISLMKGETIKQ